MTTAASKIQRLMLKHFSELVFLCRRGCVLSSNALLHSTARSSAAPSKKWGHYLHCSGGGGEAWLTSPSRAMGKVVIFWVLLSHFGWKAWLWVNYWLALKIDLSKHLKNGDDFLIVSGHLIFQLRWSWSMYGNSIRLPSESGTGISEKSLECMSDLRMGLRLHNQFPGKLSLEALWWDSTYNSTKL